MVKQNQYHNRRNKAKRARKSAYNSWLPVWAAKLPVIRRFRQMSHKRRVVLLAWSGISVLVVIGLFTTIFFANSLASKEQIMNRNKTGLTLLDQSGQQFFSFYDAHSNTYITLDKIAPVAKQAVLASEDKNFYEHGGFSIGGIANAVWQNVRPSGLDNGGSTITQQLVKNALLSEKRSVLRKYQELVLSVEIERRYSKDEILEMYLNSVYFGEGAFGIEDAAQTYFGKPASELTLSQASMLAGILPAPSAYSPISGDADKARVRQNYVLGRMEEDGTIDTATRQTAFNEQLSFAPAKTASQQQKAPHFALMVKDELEKKYGEEKIARSGYVVTTTLNLDWQAKAEAAVATQVGRLARSNVTNGSAVVIDPKSGEIKALVGSADWNNPQFGKFNIATSTKRQPGSSFKPLVYATGIEERTFSAASIFHDKPTDFGGGYSPKNYDLRYRGDVTARRALANSLNIPAVEALQQAGISDTIETAKEFGVTTLDENGSYGLSLALGTAPVPLTQMTNAYATFANAGDFNESTTVASITNKDNRKIYSHKPKNKQAISPQTSYIVSSMLSDNTARSEIFGTSLNLAGNRTAAVKTGTTEDYRDAWTIGYTPSLAIGIWIGNNDNSAMSRVAGSSGAAPIWKNLMQQIHANTPAETFKVPAGITTRAICRSNGALAETAGSNTFTEYFKPGTLPTTKCNQAQKQITPQTTTPPKQEEEPKEQTQPEVPPGSGDGGDNNSNNDNTSNGNGDGNNSNNGSSFNNLHSNPRNR